MKKTMQLSMLLLAITGITVFNSCKKDKKDDSSGKSKTELLTTGKWKLTAYTINNQNALQGIEDCSKDDILTFLANGTGVLDEGASKCDDDQTYPLEWAFSANETKFLYEGEEFTIEILNSSTLKLTSTETISGVQFNQAFTFSH